MDNTILIIILIGTTVVSCIVAIVEKYINNKVVDDMAEIHAHMLENTQCMVAEKQKELDEANAIIKRMEETMEHNGSMIVQQRKDVVTLSGVTELYEDVKPDIFDSDGKLTKLGRYLALRSVNKIVQHMYENPDEFDSFVHVTEIISADDPRVFAVVSELNLVKV